MSDDPISRHDDLVRAFRDGTVWTASEEQLRGHIRTIAESSTPNPALIATEIIRALAINHVQMDRTIRGLEDTMRDLNASNDKTQRLIVRLTWVAVAVGTIQAVASVISIVR